MNDNKKSKLQILATIIIIALLVAAFVTFFLGHFVVGSVLFVMFMIILNAISSWTRIKNTEYIHFKEHKYNEKW
ncbi:hypothetical protein FC756_10390 [Lysinibacillus mangiferihumi]|uniref:Uncharacterized protein n=1 Tax=Lysinibacillus mangiferihumi TaxID=1130819 RepID=A0A4U2Z317_9BACI|nr:hypothetical protein [Lysinibacillus mangiferihumi]TKI68547.1 hypothetical protein FC756_10390 [Lysinibacillus mangiferihumi]